LSASCASASGASIANARAALRALRVAIFISFMVLLTFIEKFE
jgi:hypothetical protein